MVSSLSVVVAILLHGHITVFIVIILLVAWALLSPVLGCLCACGGGGLWSRWQGRSGGWRSSVGSRKGSVEDTVLQCGQLGSVGGGDRGELEGAVQLRDDCRLGFGVGNFLQCALDDTQLEHHLVQ